MRITVLLLVLVLALATVLMLAPPQAQAEMPWECAWARYSPAFAFLCAYRLMMDTWNPLDWDD